MLKKALTFSSVQRLTIDDFEKLLNYQTEILPKIVEEIPSIPESFKIVCKLDFAADDVYISGSDLSVSGDIQSEDSFDLA